MIWGNWICILILEKNCQVKFQDPRPVYLWLKCRFEIDLIKLFSSSVVNGDKSKDKLLYVGLRALSEGEDVLVNTLTIKNISCAFRTSVSSSLFCLKALGNLVSCKQKVQTRTISPKSGLTKPEHGFVPRLLWNGLTHHEWWQ